MPARRRLPSKRALRRGACRLGARHVAALHWLQSVGLAPWHALRWQAAAFTLLVVGSAARADTRGEAIRHLLSLLRGSEQEYAEAFDPSGRLVQPVEIDEADLLLAAARGTAARLGNAVPADLASRLAGLDAAVRGRQPPATVLAQLQDVRRSITAATGVADRMRPPQIPSTVRGQQAFAANCTSCHGARGTGDAVDAQRLQPPAPDFTDPTYMREQSPADFFLVISLGRQRSAMPAWEEALSLQQCWDLVSYLWSLRPVRLDVGERLFVAYCARCHAAASAPAPTSGGLQATAAPLTDFDTMAMRSDADLYAKVMNGITGTAMPALQGVLSSPDAWDLVAFVRALSLASRPPSSGAATVGAASAESERAAVLRQITARVTAAVDAYRLGEADAGDLAAGAYLAFEPLEPALGTRDPAAVRRVEMEFARLQRALHQADALNEVAAAAAATARSLEAVRDATRPRLPAAGPSVAFGIACGLPAAAVLVVLYVYVTRRMRSAG